MVGLKTSVVLKPDEPSSEALGDQAGSFGVRVIVPFLASSLLPPPCSFLPAPSSLIALGKHLHYCKVK